MFFNYLLMRLLWLLWLLWLNQPLGLAIQIIGAVVQVGVITGITGILRVGLVWIKRDLVGIVSLVSLVSIVTILICVWLLGSGLAVTRRGWRHG